VLVAGHPISVAVGDARPSDVLDVETRDEHLVRPGDPMEYVSPITPRHELVHLQVEFVDLRLELAGDRRVERVGVPPRAE
jgi:hypothetical protein